jgi:hypothetical protein
LFEYNTDYMKARIRACPGVTQEAFAALAGQVLSMTSTAKFFRFMHLGDLHVGRCAQEAPIPPATVFPAAARAALRREFPLTLLPGRFRVCLYRNNPIILADAVSLISITLRDVWPTQSILVWV